MCLAKRLLCLVVPLVLFFTVYGDDYLDGTEEVQKSPNGVQQMKLRGAKENFASEDGYDIAFENHNSIQLFDQLRGKKKCETLSYCKDVGGECTKKKKCDGSIKKVKKGCSKGCVCCIPDIKPKCETWNKCKAVGGECTKKKECDGKIEKVKKGCSKGCICCIPEMCPGGVMIGSECLWFSKESLTWDAAKTACENRGQTLASLDDPQAVLDYVVKNYDAGFFLGGSYASKEGNWFGHFAKIWSDDQCPYLASNLAISLKDCKSRCNATPRCTAINYREGNTPDCVLRACQIPIPQPEWEYSAHGYKGYSTGAWIWLNGKPFPANFPWRSGEPNGHGNENCLELWAEGYNDLNCNTKKRYICE